MTQERELARKHNSANIPTHDADLAPGRCSRSSQLVAPVRPIVGGLLPHNARGAGSAAKHGCSAPDGGIDGPVGPAIDPDTVLELNSSRKIPTTSGTVAVIVNASTQWVVVVQRYQVLFRVMTGPGRVVIPVQFLKPDI